ncbi:MAG: M1 family peptidase, partial [Crocinitomicaceae bacterium]|nr:M1 family peptidase [Crocinitomicaceae bacterium]
MRIESLQIENKVHPFKHRNDTIFISGYNFLKDSIYSLKLRYQGQPTNGLIIGKNKFGDTTYFCDHWPNRAHHWLACIDHPSDKATVSVQITAPKKFTCVSNGKFESKISEENTITSSYSTIYPLPLKVIVFGLAELVYQVDIKHPKIKITNYAYPQDSINVFKDFKETKSILDFYENLIDDFPFEKLDNVQSTTQFGGMENAGCIFYDENAFKGTGINRLIAHELVHQWFGNSVTEKDWSHLWLSEGFATYLTNLYIEKIEGSNEFIQQLKKDRQRVIYFQNQLIAPLQDSISTNLMALLNPNAYQKGAWVLHMLRKEVGYDQFIQIIRSFYQQ